MQWQTNDFFFLDVTGNTQSINKSYQAIIHHFALVQSVVDPGGSRGARPPPLWPAKMC